MLHCVSLLVKILNGNDASWHEATPTVDYFSMPFNIYSYI